jgi:hypothetical protein
MDYFILIFIYILILNLIYNKVTLKNTIISLISSAFYLISFFKTFQNLKKILKINALIVYSNFKYKIWTRKLNFYNRLKKKRKIKKYRILILLVLLYFLLIPQSYSKKYISYTIKYNYIHSIFLLLIQTAFWFFVKKTIKKQIITPFYTMIFLNLLILSLIINMFSICYCLFYSLNNVLIYIPFISDAVKCYKFMREKQ